MCDRIWKFLVMVVALVLACALPAVAAGPWYVATSGVDDAGRDGLGWDSAWSTIAYAVSRATTGTIFVSNGVYTLGAQIVVDKALTIEGLNGRAHTIVNGDGSVRCFRMRAANSALRGLTLSNGYSNTGDWQRDGGGGVRINAHNVTVDNCLMTDCGTSGSGGGVFIGYDGDGGGGTNTLLTNCVIRNNQAAIGGGVRLWGGGPAVYSVTIANSEIVSNVANTGNGGGILFQGDAMVVRDSLIAYNKFMVDTNSVVSGGGVSVVSPVNAMLLERCDIVGNVVSNRGSVKGGGVSLSGNSNIVRNCRIVSNVAYLAGGGVAPGAGIYIGNSNSIIESCTIVGNVAIAWGTTYGSMGSGIHMDGNANNIVRNCIVYHNTGSATAVDMWFTNGASINNVHYTCTPMLMGGAGCITNDPSFVNAAQGNYRLPYNSPCVNAGLNQPWMSYAPDFDRQIRRIDPFSRRVDMGCYEYLPQGVLIGVR